MTITEAKEIAAKVFPYPVELEKTATGVCRIWAAHEDHKTLLGAGPSWKMALRYASQPVLEEKQKAIDAKREEENVARREAMVEANRFADFLREKFSEEFEKWKSNAAPTTEKQDAL